MILIFASVFNQLQHVVLVGVYEENLASHSNIIRKEENLIVFAGNCESSLVLHQHLTKVGCNVESETINEPVILCDVKSIGLLSSWKGSFPMPGLVPSPISHLENIGFLGYADLPTHFFL